MPKKTKITFIITFVIVLVGAILAYLWFNRNTTTNENGQTPWYQSFNPFGTAEKAGQATEENGGQATEENGTGNNGQQNPLFHQITDFAVAGATFIEDQRLKTNTQIEEPKKVEVAISANTLDGRKEIQQFLNKELSLNPPLVIDGALGNKATQAIKDFQKMKGLAITGKLDVATLKYFVKTITVNPSNDDKYEQAPSLRYIERKSGHIYRMFLDTGIKDKLSNTTIPGIYEAIFDKTGKTVIYRYISPSDKKIQTYMATLGATTGEFLPEDILDLSTSYDKSQFFYLTKSDNAVTGSIRNFNVSNKQVVFEHPFTEWLSQWGNKYIYLTTKASYGVSGSIFVLNIANKTLNKLFGGVAGLTTLVSPDGSLILYSYTTDSGPKLGVYSVKDRKTTDLGLYGLPEKCVWSNNNINVYCAIPSKINGYQYPDSWYQGLVSFDDYFMNINTITNNQELIADSSSGNPSIDGIKLFLNDKEDSLFFINKKDSTLWSLDLNK